ncbi:MAG: hypothetical protein IT196_05055 [Acidimicrobiales bacterium]|nr:hypothetical protein [Acidimicrobiales bacterium]
MLAIAAVAAATALRPGDVAPPGARTLRTAAESPPPMRFQFEIVPDSVGLQGCFSVRRRVSGTVDRRAERAGIEVDPIGIAAVVADGVTYVHRDALTGWPIPTDWVVVSAPLDEGMIAALTAALGPDLASLVLAFALPDPPSVVAEAALKAMRSAELLDVGPGDDPEVRRVKVDIDSAKLAQGTSATVSGVDDVPLTLVFTIGDTGEITAVAARISSPPSAADDENFGYRTTYETDESVAAPDLPNPDDVTTIDEVAIPESPRPPDISCTVGP